MTNHGRSGHFVFPRWANLLLPGLVAVAITGPLYVVAVVGYGGSPQTTDVGYQPQQPVAFSHAMHAGELGMDCRYCHTTVEHAAMAALPPTQTCMNCHSAILPDSEKMRPVLESYRTGMPILWVKVHDLPDYAYFNHAAHVRVGVSCVSCHGRVDRMEQVRQVQPLSMLWCLACHREPEENLRPVEFVTDLGWKWPEGVDPIERGLELKAQMNIASPRQLTDCSVCHR